MPLEGLTGRTAITALLAVAIPSLATAWTSALYLPDGDGGHVRAVVEHDGRTWQLPDHSYAGYARGEQALGAAVPCRTFDVEARDGANITAALQAAVDRAQAAGGGVVRIPAGRFVVDAPIGVTGNRVSIEGAGSARTTLEIPDTFDPPNDWDNGVLSFGRAGDTWRQGWWSHAPRLTTLARAAETGDRDVHVTDADVLRAGQWIALVQYLSAAQSRTESGGAWPAVDGLPAEPDWRDRRHSRAVLRRITRIDGDRVTLDAPLPGPLDPADNPVGVVAPMQAGGSASIQDVGASGLRVTFADNTPSDFGNGPDGRPVGNGVLFEGVVGGWLHDIVIDRAPRFGVQLTHSARVTLHRVAALDRQDAGTGGWGYGFNLYAAQDVLVREAVAENMRHGYVISGRPSSNIVITGSQSWGATADGDDTHFGPARQVLFDQHRWLYGAGLQLLYRGTFSGGAHETVDTAVVWNAGGDGARGAWYGGGLLLNPMGHALVIGTDAAQDVIDVHGPLIDQRLQRVAAKPGLQAVDAAGRGLGARTSNVLYEGIGQPGLTPAALYPAQLAARTGSGSTRFAGGCGQQPAAARITPNLDTGPGLLWFDSDHTAAVAHRQSGCTDCNPDARVNHTPGGREALRITLSDKVWAPGIRLRHRRQRAADWERLTFIARADQDVVIRLRLQDSRIPDSESVFGQHADVRIGAAESWQRITVDLAALAGLDHFDAITLNSAGPASAHAVVIDDLRLR